MPFESFEATPSCLVVMVEGLVTQSELRRAVAVAHDADSKDMTSLVVSVERVNADGIDLDRELMNVFAPAWARLERIAFVGDIAKYAPAAKMFGPKTSAAIKGYRSAELETAIVWACGAKG